MEQQVKLSIEDRVKNIICNKLAVKPEKVTPEADLRTDLGADSLDLMELSSSLEEEFGIRIPEADEKTIQTYGDAVRYVRAYYSRQ